MNWKRRFISLLICMALLFGMVPGMAAHAAETAGGTCGNYLTWKLEDGVLTISGSGAMYGYGMEEAPWYPYADSIESLVVEDGVTTISKCAFYKCSQLTEVSLASSIRDIGYFAFLRCESLKEITLPDSVRYVGEDAFSDCTSLKKVTLSKNIYTISESLFSGCTSLEEITLPENADYIAAKVFENCISLTSVVIPSRVYAISESMFNGCSGLKSVTLPEGLEEIKSTAFLGCHSLGSILLPEGLLIIGDAAFNQCDKLTDVTIPASVTRVGELAFSDCANLKEVTFVGDAPYIGDKAFRGATATVYYDADNTTWTDDLMYDYGGDLTWVACEGGIHTHSFTEIVTAPTCVREGTTSKVCACGASYVVDQTEALGHDYEGFICSRCGEKGSYPLKTRPASGGAVSSNLNSQDYRYYAADPIQSVLAEENGGYLRAECIGENIIVERYSKDYVLQETKTIPLELELFGGIYICDDYNFVVCGQNNSKEYNSVEVIRVIRYDKDWTREAGVSLCGANTAAPFRSGSLRFARSGDMLYIRTSHLMYEIEGVNHQANLTLSVNIPDMKITDTFYGIMNVDYGYVSHSFNQFIQVDGKDLLAVDHGDAGPRSAVLIKYEKNAGEEYFAGHVDHIDVLKIAANKGHYNYTGVSLGSFEYSDTHYLVAGNTCDQGGGIDQEKAQRNIFLTATPKGEFSEASTSVIYFTDYGESDHIAVSNPHLVKLDGNTFCLMWSVRDTVYYCMVDGAGQRTTEIYTAEGALSDCAPILAEHKIVWYVTNGSSPVFYEINLKHEYASAVTKPDCTHGGYTTFTCDCGDYYVSERTDPLGHSYRNGSCQVCGEIEPGVDRLAGANRWATSLAVADEMKENLGIEKFDAVIIASGDNFADALAGSYLSAVKSAPILLCWNGGGRFEYLNQNILDYIDMNLAEDGTVYILGGKGAVPMSFDEALGDRVNRLNGSNRFETNLMILKEAGVKAGEEILVCTSTNFADSLSASATGKPILLVFNEGGKLFDNQIAYLETLSGNTFTILGGNGAVSEKLAGLIGAYGTVSRLAGANRFETSVLVAETYFDSPDTVVLAYAWNYPDGLCGGSLAYSLNAPLILTMAKYEASATEYISSRGIVRGIVLGGTSLLPDDSIREIFSLTAEDTITVK